MMRGIHYNSPTLRQEDSTLQQASIRKSSAPGSAGEIMVTLPEAECHQSSNPVHAKLARLKGRGPELPAVHFLAGSWPALHFWTAAGRQSIFGSGLQTRSPSKNGRRADGARAVRQKMGRRRWTPRALSRKWIAHLSAPPHLPTVPKT